MQAVTIVNFMKASLQDMPKHKLVYLIERKEMVKSIWANLNHYGIEFNTVNHELLIDVVQFLLEGPDLEREWSEAEYENFVQYKGE